MKNRQLRFRPHPSPLLTQPINVRSCGFYRLPPTIRIDREPGTFTQIFWTIQGHGNAQVGRRRLSLPPKTVFLYYPGEVHALTALEKEDWQYFWFTIDGPWALLVTKMFGLERIQPVSHCPQELFRRLDTCLRDATPMAEQKAALLGYKILLLAASTHASDSPEPQKTLAKRMRHILDSRFHEPTFNISLLSQEFRMHRSTLYRLFIREYGISPIQYLMRIRLGYAIEQLKDNRQSISDIGRQSGLPDTNYFCKLIKKVTGQTPRQLR